MAKAARRIGDAPADKPMTDKEIKAAEKAAQKAANKAAQEAQDKANAEAAKIARGPGIDEAAQAAQAQAATLAQLEQQPPVERPSDVATNKGMSLKEAMALSAGKLDAPKVQNRQTRETNNADDKVTGLAEQFHAEADEAEDTAELAAGVSPLARARAFPSEVSSEDRRRAILSEQQGVDLFPRQGNERPGEPTLQECNAQFLKEENTKRVAQAEFHKSAGEQLAAMFGPGGARRVQKNLR